MSNLFTTIEKIHKLKAGNRLNTSQKQMITGILIGPKHPKGWRNLTQAALDPIKEENNNIRNFVQYELAKTPYISLKPLGFNFAYKSALKEIEKSVIAIEAKREEMHTRYQNKPMEVKKRAQVRDKVYEQTIEKYKGRMILPLAQINELRLGDSGGECYGYVMEWALKLLQGKKPFGIDYTQSPPFKPVAYNSAVGLQYPELNHLAALTSDIAKYQAGQKNIKRILQSLTNILFPNQQNREIEKKDEAMLRYYFNGKGMAEHLVKLAEAGPHKMFMLCVNGGTSGHALGFSKRGEEYHFIDSNFGWVSFKKADDFKKWLPFYLKTFGYDKVFTNYSIDSFFVNNNKKPEPKPNLLTRIVTTLIALPFVIPVLVGFISYMLIGHAVVKIQRTLQEKFEAYKSKFKQAAKNTSQQRKPMDKSKLYSGTKQSRDDFKVGLNSPKTPMAEEKTISKPQTKTLFTRRYSEPAISPSRPVVELEVKGRQFRR